MHDTVPLHIPFAELADFCRRYQVRELALFGSMLRQDPRPDSDVDLLVSFATSSTRDLSDPGQNATRTRSLLGAQSRFSTQGRLEASHS